jgi:hypothetical protein
MFGKLSFGLQALWNATEVLLHWRGQWFEETLQEAVNRVQAEEVGKREGTGYYWSSAENLHRRNTTAKFINAGLCPQGAPGQANEKVLVKYIKRLRAAGLPPNKHSRTPLAISLRTSWVLVTNFRNNKKWRVTWFALFRKFLLYRMIEGFRDKAKDRKNTNSVPSRLSHTLPPLSKGYTWFSTAI